MGLTLKCFPYRSVQSLQLSLSFFPASYHRHSRHLTTGTASMVDIDLISSHKTILSSAGLLSLPNAIVPINL